MKTKIVFNAEIMKLISLFETITGTKVKDCILTDYYTIFILPPGMIGKAVGKKGANVQRLQKMLNRKIKIVEFDSNLMGFIKNLVYPLKIKEITEQEKIIKITAVDTQTRGFLIGRNAQNLRQLENIVKRYFDIIEIKVT